MIGDFLSLLVLCCYTYLQQWRHVRQFGRMFHHPRAVNWLNKWVTGYDMLFPAKSTEAIVDRGKLVDPNSCTQSYIAILVLYEPHTTH